MSKKKTNDNCQRYSLGRRPEMDPRSKLYPIRQLISQKKPRSYTWSCYARLDQGFQSSCVGHAWAAELAARPKVIKGMTHEAAVNIYKKAQDLDQWPGNTYEGTSVLAGAKAVQELYPKKIIEFRWTQSLEDLIITLGYFGPVVLGVNWYSNMFNPDENGLIKVGGSLSGGHALLAIGVNLKNELIMLRNSWGTAFGVNGDCYISFSDMNKLLNKGGEGCVLVRRGF